MKSLVPCLFVFLTLWGGSASFADQITIVGEKSDAGVTEVAHVDHNGSTSSKTFRAGLAVGSPGTTGRAGVWVFRLPEGLAADQVHSVSFAVTLSHINEFYPNMHFSVDLYGLSARPDSRVLGTDYYHGELDARQDVFLIQKDFYRAGNANVKHLAVTTSPQANSALTEFIVNELKSGGAGKYVFLRVNPNFATGYSSRRGYDFVTADNDTPGIILPTLTITTAP